MLPTITRTEHVGLPSWYRRPFGVGAEGPDVRIVLRKLGLDPEGPFDELAVTRVKGIARRMGMFEHDGVVDATIASALGEAATAALVPDWFTIGPGDEGSIVARARRLLDVGEGSAYTEEMEAAVRRLQSANRLAPTGVIDAVTARLLGEL